MSPPKLSLCGNQTLPGISSLLSSNIQIDRKALLKHCVTARAAPGELKQGAELIPLQTLLISSISLLETKDGIHKVVSFTHRDPRERHIAGWLRHGGRIYQ
ncbi:MAG: DUF3465 domain-containing protein [Pseudomonadales bacterium]|nr:DUF3465 domain-containing protein [Pseudomonadales bacterium]MCP5349284.1 DUF3465 domain-containing protein [Pseudomonadales bacterium]